MLRVFVGWGDNYEAAAEGSFIGVLISPPATTVPDAYFLNVRDFLQDVQTSGIRKVILSIGGSGSYSPGICDNDLAGLILPTFKNGLAKLMSSAVNVPGQNLQIKIDLGNEIAPSNYESQCTKDARTSFIQAVWSYYVDNYGTSRASFSSIMDDSADFHVAGNRLANLIGAIAATGKGFPAWFEVHVYGSSNPTTNMLRGVYQIYSDHGFLSNGQYPKETVIGETFYEDANSALGMDSYMNIYDEFNNGKINLAAVIAWPLAQPMGCSIGVNVAPPYTSGAYKNTISVIFQSGFDVAGF